jgi:hypothetical protein
MGSVDQHFSAHETFLSGARESTFNLRCRHFSGVSPDRPGFGDDLHDRALPGSNLQGNSGSASTCRLYSWLSGQSQSRFYGVLNGALGRRVSPTWKQGRSFLLQPAKRLSRHSP